MHRKGKKKVRSIFSLSFMGFLISSTIFPLLLLFVLSLQFSVCCAHYDVCAMVLPLLTLLAIFHSCIHSHSETLFK